MKTRFPQKCSSATCGILAYSGGASSYYLHDPLTHSCIGIKEPLLGIISRCINKASHNVTLFAKTFKSTESSTPVSYLTSTHQHTHQRPIRLEK